MEQLDTIAIIGIGLIGGSLGRALVCNHAAKRVIGIDVNKDNCRLALELNAATETTSSLKSGAADADLIILGAPVGLIPDLIVQAAKVNTKSALITDLGSTKEKLIETLQRAPLANGCRFIGGHPIAGKEKSGVEAADPNLFAGRAVVLTTFEPVSRQAISEAAASRPAFDPAEIRRIMRPLDVDPDSPQYPARLNQIQQDRQALKLRDFSILYDLWESVGAFVLQMSPQEHDRILAQTSHLPHVLSVALLKTLDASRIQLTGTGFRSVGRLAGGSVEIWKDILLGNSENLVSELDKFIHLLLTLRGVLDRKEQDALVQFLSDANQKYHENFE